MSRSSAANRRRRTSARNKRDIKHVRVYLNETDLPAWKDLSGIACKILIILRMGFNGHNNGEIFLSVRDAAERAGCAKDTAYRALQELIDKGWIKIRVRGSFSRKVKHATSYILTDQPFLGREPTRDFAQWKPPPKKQNPVPKFMPDDTDFDDRPAADPHVTDQKIGTVNGHNQRSTVRRFMTHSVYPPGRPLLGQD